MMKTQQLEIPLFCGTGPDFPPHDLISINDEQTKGVMLKLGITELFIDTGKHSIRFYVYKDHPTHWFIFIRWELCPNPQDNGFSLYGYSKMHSHDWFVQQCLGITKNYMTEEPIVTDPQDPSNPYKN